MRRILIGMTLLALTPGITQAFYRSISPRERIRYSPYALSYRSSGLIPGAIHYSPYVHGPESSGLAFEGLRYTPYAQTYGNTGLVLDYYWWPIPYMPYYPARPPYPVYCLPACVPCPPKPNCSTPGAYGTGNVQRRTAPGMSFETPARNRSESVASTQPRPTRQDDGMMVIRQYLLGQGFTNAAIGRILRIDGVLVSVDFVLRDRNLIVKYWNPEKIDSLNAQADARQRMYAAYKQDWDSFAQAHKRNGGKVYCVNASKRDEIVAVLQACDELNPRGGDSDGEVMYARQ